MVNARHVSTASNAKMYSEVVAITPAMAEKWLETNHDNRSVSEATVDRYAHDMKTGAWELTHQGIAFNRNGVLADGQHRLWAIIRSGCTIQMVVFYNSDLTYRSNIDVGYNRTVGQITGITPRVVSVVRALKQFETNVFRQSKISPAEVLQIKARWAWETSWLFDARSDNSRLFNTHTRDLPAPVLAALAYAVRLDQEKVEAIAIRLRDGEMLSARDPEYRFRKWLLENNASGQDIAFAACNAIRYAMIGADIKSIYTTPSGYVALTTARRAKRLQNTPTHAQTGSLTLRSGTAGTKATKKGA